MEPAGRPAGIHCESLPVFDRTDCESVRSAFESVVPCPFQQAWLCESEDGFSPGEVRMGWRGCSLLVFAELTDLDIHNGATSLNQHTWELGDVFEIFLRSAEQQSYVELHVTPQNQRLQLHYPDARAAQSAREHGRLDDFLTRQEVFHSKTWIDAPLNRWQIYAEIPARTVCGSDQSIQGTQWRFSFGRYDYTRGVEKPVVSSTSPHAKPDFHRQHEWGVITFKKALWIRD